MPPDVSARVLPRASCDLEEGELSPSPAAANPASPRPPTENLSISAAEAEAAALDFFEGVAAHRAEQSSKEWESHSSTASPCALPSSEGVRTPEVAAQAEAAPDASERLDPPNSLPEPAGVCSGTSTGRTPKGGPLGKGACPANSSSSDPPCLPSARATEEQGGGRPQDSSFLPEIQHVSQDQAPLSSVRPLLSPCGSIVGLLQQHSQQQQQRHDEGTKSKALLPLDLHKAHQQRMQTLDVQRGTEALDDPLHIGPNEDLMQHVQRLSTKIRAQEDEKEKLNGECQGLRGALAVLDEVLEGFFNRQMRPPPPVEAPEENKGIAEPSETQAPSACNLQNLYDALMDAFRAEASTLDKEAEEELRQRIEAATALCRAATAGVVASGVLSSSAWHGGPLLDHLPARSIPGGPYAVGATGPPGEQAVNGSTLGLLRPLGSPPSSSEAQLETLKAQIERLRDNLGAFTEGVLHAHKRHVRSHKQLKTIKSESQASEKLGALKAAGGASSAGGAPTFPVSEEKARLLAAARKPPPAALPVLPAGPPVGVPLMGKEKARRPLWSNATIGGGPPKTTKGNVQLQQPLLADPLRGAVLLPASQSRHQPQQQQRLRCKPCPGGTPLDVCCEGSCGGGAPQQGRAPSRTGIVLPPLRQRQRQSSRGPCGRRRVPSGGPSSHGGAAGRNLSNSASAAALLPALKPAASAAATTSKGLMGSASAVDLSLVGRHVGSSQTAANRFVPLYEGPPLPPLGVYGYTPGTRSLHPSASPSAPARSQWGASARSNSSSSSGRVFSRTRRSCSPIGERIRSGASGGPPGSGALREASVGGAPSHRRRMTDVLSLESKVGPVGSEGKEKAIRAPPPLYAKDAWEPPQFQPFGGPQGFFSLPWGGGPPPAYYPPPMGPHHSAARIPKELSPSAASTGGKSGKGPSIVGEEGGLPYSNNRMWTPTNTRLVAAAGNQEAMAAAAAAAGLVASSSGVYMYSQPPKTGGPPLMGLSPHYLFQQQRYRQASPIGHSPTSSASAQAAGSFKAHTPSSFNACSPNPLQYRLISPTSGRTPSLSSFSAPQLGRLSAGAAACSAPYATRTLL
ncbi:hypothetical protein ACSSS7_002025 [Eimeria intestinalis]